MKKFITLESKVDHILFNVIRDLEPIKLIELRTALIDAGHGNINDIIKYARFLLSNNFSITTTGRNYWTARGWSEAHAQAKIVDKRKNAKKRISAFSIEFWLNKINPHTNLIYTKEEADFKRNSLRPIRSEYWQIRGYNEVDARAMAVNVKNTNNASGAKSMKNSSKDKLKSCSKRCKEFWMVRGQTEQEALLSVKEVQQTFTKEKCIRRHGYEDGLKIWNERQKKWQDTLNSKSEQEISDINKRKITGGYTISKAERELLQILQEKFPAIDSQIVIRDSNKSYIFDLGVGDKFIEYNGTYWHADPRYYRPTSLIRNKTAYEIWQRDKHKLEAAKKHGYSVLCIWESDFKTSKDKEIKKCIDFLTQ